MPRVQNLSIHHSLIEKVEIGITIFLLICFLGVFQLPISTSPLNILSYPLTAILVALHWKRISWIAIRDIPLLLLCGLSLASIIWSIAPELSLNTNRGLLRMFLFGAYIAARYSLREQIKIYAWVFGIEIILSLVVALAIPGYGFSTEIVEHDNAFTGLFSYKNSMGYSLVTATVTFLVLALKKRKSNWLAWSLFCLAVTLIPWTNSSASLVCLLVVMSPLPLYKLIKLHYKTKVLILCLVSILVGIIAAIILGNLETILVDILGESTQFSGRMPIWTAIIEKVGEEKPWLGYGTSSFWQSDEGLSVIMTTWGSNNQQNLLSQKFNYHSSYIAILANLGFLGLFLFMMSWATVFVRVFTLLISTKRIEFFWCFQILIFILLGGFADDLVSILKSNSYFTIYVSICLSTAVEWRRINLKKNRNYKLGGDRLSEKSN